MLKAGLALKLDQIKLALTSYARDRADQGKGIAVGYAVAAGLFVVAGLFVLAACFVGFAALFRWLEIRYGEFIAFAIIGGILLVLAALCATIGMIRMRPAKPTYPSLGSRMRVAIKANPLEGTSWPLAAGAALTQRSPAKPAAKRSDPVDSARRTAADVLRSTSAPLSPGLSARSRSGARAGVALAATLLGWALVRRYGQSQRLDS